MDSNKQLTTKTNEENNRVRAAVLKDLDWDISPDSELFPLVKMNVLGAASNDAKMKQLAGMISQLNVKLEEAKAVGGLTRSGWEIFLHGFGRWGFVTCFGILVAALVCVHIHDNGGAQPAADPAAVRTIYVPTPRPAIKKIPKHRKRDHARPADSIEVN